MRKFNLFFYIDYIYKIKKINDGLGGIILERTKINGREDKNIIGNKSLYWDELSSKYIKNYDLEENVFNWEKDFGMENWGVLIAYDDKKPVGAATIAFNTKGVNMLSGRKDMTVLWDIRVEDSYKGKGIGSKLFEKAVEWSKERNCVQMKIETQNINSKACEFYKKQGSILGKVDEYAYYGECDGEVQLIWYKNL
jgi:GNAT superfamily N-acetyltransferase